MIIIVICQRILEESIAEIPLFEKPYFLFPNVLKRWFFQKKLRRNMVFLVLSGKMTFLLPENMILFFRDKRKDDLSQKNT